MVKNKKITELEAIELAQSDTGLPTLIHQEIIKNYEKENRFGILSFITLENPIVTKKIVDGKKYFEIVFKKGDLSWQEIDMIKKEVKCFFDGDFEDEIFAKCLVSEDGLNLIYTGICNIKPHKPIEMHTENELDENKKSPIVKKQIKKSNLIVIILLFLIIIIVIFLKIFTPEDTWVCNNGSWVKHGNPSNNMPTNKCNIE